MNYKILTKTRILYYSIHLLLFIILCFFANVTQDAVILLISIGLIILIESTIFFLMEYFKKVRFYKEYANLLDNLEAKYLLPDLIEKPDFQDGIILYETLYTVGKSMKDEINRLSIAQKEYREYIEQWVHEIKTPISALHLLLEGNLDSQLIRDELLEIEGFTQQVLYYARCQNPEKDFCIKQTEVSQLITDIIQKYASKFIYQKIALIYEPVPQYLYTDGKWVSYILEQLLSNAIKYSLTEASCITIHGITTKNKYSIQIVDNGIGIPPEDLRRVFEKGFTGSNGRVYGQSTGMGLYLCKLLCDKLLIDITIISEKNQGTTVTLTWSL